MDPKTYLTNAIEGGVCRHGAASNGARYRRYTRVTKSTASPDGRLQRARGGFRVRMCRPCSAGAAEARAGAGYAGLVNRSKGMLLLGVWVILSNLLPILSLRIPNGGLLLTVLGIVAGVLLLVDR